ncbi:hypothetical protein EVAR_39876_1 [Eumeta japonica]|uniref:Mos1 transposase HTH domain-containing protein n=1 Tax=Eumeta variegata TaxID=151549 RepID=A0A4C1WT21_EUMVA|nr:hypothetical protein EVAR_39876_1 [Eumeta japonica]
MPPAICCLDVDSDSIARFDPGPAIPIAIFSNLGSSLTIDSLTRLQTAFGDEVLCKTTNYNWFAEFKLGRVNLSDEFRNGRPSTAVNNKTIDSVCCMIETDRYVTYYQIRASLGISFSYGETDKQIIEGEKRKAYGQPCIQSRPGTLRLFCSQKLRTNYAVNDFFSSEEAVEENEKHVSEVTRAADKSRARINRPGLSGVGGQFGTVDQGPTPHLQDYITTCGTDW